VDHGTAFDIASTGKADHASMLQALRQAIELAPEFATLNALADTEGVELIALGGEMRHISQGTVGPLAEEALARFTADAVFMSADGVTACRGLCEASVGQASVKGTMIERSGPSMCWPAPASSGAPARIDGPRRPSAGR
jgi:DeoR/GlpR family transcriptional regulator of sugar metabolism